MKDNLLDIDLLTYVISPFLAPVFGLTNWIGLTENTTNNNVQESSLNGLSLTINSDTVTLDNPILYIVFYGISLLETLILPLLDYKISMLENE